MLQLVDSSNILNSEFSKNPFIRALNFEGQTAVGSYSMIPNSKIRFSVTETVNIHNNLHFY